MGRKMDLENWVIEQGMECQSISLEEKYLIEKYNELEEKEDQVYAWLLSQDDELIQKAVLKLKQIDQVQDQIIIRLLECEDKQISGHVHLNQKLGRIKFLKTIFCRSPKYLEVKNLYSGSFEEVPETVRYQLWRKRQEGKVPLAW